VDMDLLMSILSLQRADGGFDLAKADLRRLGISAAAITRAAACVPGDPAQAVRALHTSLVLALLEVRFRDARDTWFSAVKKSRTWLKKITAGWGQILDGKTVIQWARALAEKPGPMWRP
jgi:hypothetical protein